MEQVREKDFLQQRAVLWATSVANVLVPMGHSVVSVHAEPGDCLCNAAYHTNAYLHVRCTAWIWPPTLFCGLRVCCWSHSTCRRSCHKFVDIASENMHCKFSASSVAWGFAVHLTAYLRGIVTQQQSRSNTASQPCLLLEALLLIWGHSELVYICTMQLLVSVAGWRVCQCTQTLSAHLLDLPSLLASGQTFWGSRWAFTYWSIIHWGSRTLGSSVASMQPLGFFQVLRGFLRGCCGSQ